MENDDGFVYKTKPYKHQAEVFQATRDRAAWGLLWEMGCGKTKPVLDTAAFLLEAGEIDGLLILAPNGVHANWITDEIPTHLVERIRCVALAHHSARARQVEHQRRIRQLLHAEKRRELAVLSMTYDALRTDVGEKLVRTFLAERRCLFVCDESARIKSPGAKQTKRVLGLAGKAPYRRILNGTPVPNKAYDIYSQVRFLDLDFWKRRGFANFDAFKQDLCVFAQRSFGGRGFQQVVGYRHGRLEWLRDEVATIAHRLTKDEVLDLPAKTYAKRRFAMTPAQTKVYQDLVEQFRVELEGGVEITAPMAVTRLLRLHQVTSGYLPTDEDGRFVDIGTENPRLALLGEIVEDIEDQAIIWARFRRDIDLITALLGNRVVRYDGSCGLAQRQESIARFRSGGAQFFVANPACIGMGVTLTEAKAVVYYNNSFNLTDRLQSEDRCHRIGQTRSVPYIDIIAEGTVDEKIVSALREKKDVASVVVGDALREWI